MENDDRTNEPLEEDWEEDESEGVEDDSDLRRRSFLERHDWIPWMAAAILIGGILGSLPEGS